METHILFPVAAFKDESPALRLKHIFTGRTYRAEDVVSIRTSVHYKNFRSDGPCHKYETAAAFAYKKPDGQFQLSILRNTILDNQVQGFFSIFHSSENRAPEICGPENIIAKMRQLEDQLSGESELSQAYPRNPPLRYQDSLHIDAAAMIFSEPATADDIVSNINRNIVYDGAAPRTAIVTPP